MKTISNEFDYRSVMGEIAELMRAGVEAGSADADHLVELANLARAYENATVMARPVDPTEAIRLRMGQAGVGPQERAHTRPPG